MWTMYDSTEPGQIPGSATAVAGYVGGRWPDFAEEMRRWPHAQQLSIAINASEDAECLDVETGDATPAEAPGWFKRQRARGRLRTKLYCSLSVVPALEAEMSRAGIHRSEYQIWSAHYSGVPHICGPSEGLSSPADATQWTDRALGRNLDESLCSDAFFLPSPYVPADERRWKREYDSLYHRKDPWAMLRRRVLRRTMTARRKEIWHRAEAEPGGWKKLNRAARWRSLKART